MACAGICASISTSVSQNCLDINPISFNLPAAVVGPTSTTYNNAYQSTGGSVTATGVMNVQGTISTATDVILTFFQGAAIVGTITFTNVTDGSTWGFSELTPFDRMDVTINNNDIAAASTGALDIVMIVNY